MEPFSLKYLHSSPRPIFLRPGTIGFNRFRALPFGPLPFTNNDREYHYGSKVERSTYSVPWIFCPFGQALRTGFLCLAISIEKRSAKHS